METALPIAVLALILQVFVLRSALSISARMKVQAAQLKLHILMARKAGIDQSEIDLALKDLYHPLVN